MTLLEFRRMGYGFVLCACLAEMALANSPPVVTNVTASQRADGSKLVDIYYSLADADGDACTVWVAGSNNGGASWTLPVMTLTGAVGANVTPGTGKHIVWDAGADLPGLVGDFKTRVWADDGNGYSDMVIVGSGWFLYQGTQSVFLPTYLIDKYEVTNSQYVEFLNNADPNGDHWDANMEIVRTGTPGAYVYGVAPGRNSYPIRYANFYDADAFATWRSAQDGVMYALPSGEQWEKAAAWDPVEQHYYTYGFHQDVIDSTWCNYNNYIGGPTPVGSYNGTGGREDAKSYYGCYDMSGNVWEWTSEVSGSNRVVRGGAWGRDAADCACAIRDIGPPSLRSHYGGFRLVLDPS
jgi:hypothetical protein